MTNSIYRDVLDEEVAFPINASGAKGLCRGPGAARQSPASRRPGPNRSDPVPLDPRGMRRFDDPRVLSMEAPKEIGNKAHAADLSAYDKHVDGAAAMMLHSMHDVRHDIESEACGVAARRVHPPRSQVSRR